jgi:hypothetical protein
MGATYPYYLLCSGPDMAAALPKTQYQAGLYKAFSAS